MYASMIWLAFWTITFYTGWTRTGPFAPGPCGLERCNMRCSSCKILQTFGEGRHPRRADLRSFYFWHHLNSHWIHLTFFFGRIFWISFEFLLISCDMVWIHSPGSEELSDSSHGRLRGQNACGRLWQLIGTLFCVRIQILLLFGWFHLRNLIYNLKSLSEFWRAEFSAMTLLQAMAGMKPDTLARVQVYKEPIDFKAPNPALHCLQSWMNTYHWIHSKYTEITRRNPWGKLCTVLDKQDQ